MDAGAATRQGNGTLSDIGAAMSLLEPALIIFLAVIVGSVVIALFLPILAGIPDSGPDRGM